VAPRRRAASTLARGKLLPRDRVEALLDPGSPFLEFAPLAGEGLYDGVPPGASMVTGIGLVEGRPVHGHRQRRHREGRHLLRHHLPQACARAADRLGAPAAVPHAGRQRRRLPARQAHIFPDEGQFGSIFDQQVRMSAEGIAQIAVVMGPCTAGGAYIPALCDEP
jgi:3-methylcrotonyl-CoA carboxylase beta subunit